MNFSIYKNGQGKNTRIWSAVAAGILAVLGCYKLYEQLEGIIWPGSISVKTGMWIATMIPVAIFIGLAFLIFWIMNKTSVVDFLISAEGEMKKVSWSSRQEITVSTFVVIVVVIIMAMLLGAADYGFTIFFKWLLG
jgi:preprotein translocase subunit SecE